MSLSLQEKIDLVIKRWPFIQSSVTLQVALDHTVTGDTPVPTLVFQGLHISSAVDPYREAIVQADSIPTECQEVWVYGVGSGELINLLLSRPAIKCLNLVLFNRSLFARSLAVYPHSWLGDKRVRLFDVGSLTLFGRPFVAIYPELQLAEREAHPLRDRVMAALDDQLRSYNLSDRQNKRDRHNLSANQQFIEQDRDVAELDNCFKGQAVTVIAGGPTSSDYLAAPVPSDGLVVVSTALKAVLQSGLRPDYVVAIDSHPGLVRHFEGIEDWGGGSHTVLLYAPSVDPQVLAHWFGRRAVFYLDSPFFNSLTERLPRTTLFCSGTVTHSAIDFAVRAGASEVRLVGADFAFPGGMSHGMHMNPRRVQRYQVEVANGCGEMIGSTPALISYLRDLEFYISQHPEVCFVNMSDQGAQIRGAKYFNDGHVI